MVPRNRKHPKIALVYGEGQEGWQEVDTMEKGTSLLFVVKQAILVLCGLCMWAENGGIF